MVVIIFFFLKIYAMYCKGVDKGGVVLVVVVVVMVVALVLKVLVVVVLVFF